MNPLVTAVACFVSGAGAAVGGVYVLAGLGWALVAVAVPLVVASALLFRGLIDA